MAHRGPKSATFSTLTSLKQDAVRRRVALLEDARLQALFEQESLAVNLLTDAQVADELGIKLDGTDKEVVDTPVVIASLKKS